MELQEIQEILQEAEAREANAGERERDGDIIKSTKGNTEQIAASAAEFQEGDAADRDTKAASAGDLRGGDAADRDTTAADTAG